MKLRYCVCVLAGDTSETVHCCVCVVAGDTSDASAAVIGGSVGGVIALILLIGVIILAGVLIPLRRKSAQ